MSTESRPRTRLPRRATAVPPRSLGVALLLLAAASGVHAQGNGKSAPKQDEGGPRGEIYGFAMTDFGFDFRQNDPNWFDTMRPTKLPAFPDEFGQDGRTYVGVRQTRFGVKGFFPTGLGEMRTVFEWELFGVGVDAGQTTIRLRHAYGELGNFLAGQTWSPFMDPDVFPNSLEYWGPPGMVFFRNVQLRWTPFRGKNQLAFALERPGASGDAGRFADRIEIQGITPRFPLPDFTAHVRVERGWGHVQLAGIVRDIRWDDNLANDTIDLSGRTTGWGVNLSSNIKAFKKDVIRFSVVYGHAIENYMNDAPADVGIETNFGDPTRPILGEGLPLLGIVAFYDRTWSHLFTSSLGYSRIDIDNTDGQTPEAFRTGQYALVNFQYHPLTDLMAGAEFQWGQRRNHSNGFVFDDYRIQLGFRYNFLFKVGSASTSAAGGQ